LYRREYFQMIALVLLFLLLILFCWSVQSELTPKNEIIDTNPILADASTQNEALTDQESKTKLDEPQADSIPSSLVDSQQGSAQETRETPETTQDKTPETTTQEQSSENTHDGTISASSTAVSTTTPPTKTPQEEVAEIISAIDKLHLKVRKDINCSKAQGIVDALYSENAKPFVLTENQHQNVPSNLAEAPISSQIDPNANSVAAAAAQKAIFLAKKKIKEAEYDARKAILKILLTDYSYTCGVTPSPQLLFSIKQQKQLHKQLVKQAKATNKAFAKNNKVKKDKKFPNQKNKKQKQKKQKKDKNKKSKQYE